MYLSLLGVGDSVVTIGIVGEGVAVVAPAQSHTNPSLHLSLPREGVVQEPLGQLSLAQMVEMAAFPLVQRRHFPAVGEQQALVAHVHGLLDGGSTSLVLGLRRIINLSVAEMVTMMFACVVNQMAGPVVAQLVTPKLCNKAPVEEVEGGTAAQVGL